MIAAITTRKTITRPVDDFGSIKQKVLNWIQQFNTFCFLDNNQYNIGPHTQECLAAAGINRQLSATAGSALAQLQAFMDEKKSNWLFGHIGYDLKNELEQLSSSHPDHIGFPDLFFFEPSVVIRLSETAVCIEAEDPAAIWSAIMNGTVQATRLQTPATIQSSFTKDQYIAVIEKLKQHILRGDCYEINFCQEFFAENARIDPAGVYRELNRISPNPFSAFYRVGDQWLICASPERYLKKQGPRLLSQPIKGTLKREQEDGTRDSLAREQLFLSRKDRSENVMVVDLVRNDLAKVCKEGSVQVDELYGIYSFPQVHQMISTVSGELRENVPFTEIIRATFPMGSMTGAPKKRVMELIEEYEQVKRGIFSGAIGYISPDGDFDFNVVIRSLMYNAAEAYLSYQAGSGITYYSDPENEWEECMVKAAAIKEVLLAAP